MRKAKKTYTHFTREERGILHMLRVNKAKMAEMVRFLKKAPSTIRRELKRNANVNGVYYTVLAEHKAKQRRLQSKAGSRILENDDPTREYVIQGLVERASPDQISGNMHRYLHPRPVARNTIYRFVRRNWQGMKQHLRFRGRSRPYGVGPKVWDTRRPHISQRAKIVEKRLRLGDWEGDLVSGPRTGIETDCILTLNCRASGIVVARKLKSKHQTGVGKAIVRALRGLPVKTLTLDNGSEFNNWKYVRRKLHCKIYFTDVASPHQRGSNENFNGVLRDDFPKGQSLARKDQGDVRRAIRRLNVRPRKRYGYTAPKYRFFELGGTQTHWRQLERNLM